MPPAEMTVLALGHRFASLDVERAVLAGLAEVVDGNALASEQRQPALAQARAVLLGTRDRLDAPAIAAMEKCRIIVRYGIGVDNVDIAAATRRGIVVSNVRDYAIEEVSDHALALLLAANRHLIPAHAAARSRQWGTAPMAGVRRLCSQTVGVVGFGRIGQAMARKVKPLAARVVAYDSVVPPEIMGEQGVEACDFATLLGVSDYVSIHCPLTPETRHLFNAQSLARMKPTAWLINTARGEIVDEPALAAALAGGRLGGVALDVLTQEPPPEDHPLFRLDNVLLTSHVAFFSKEALLDLQHLAAEEARRVLVGDRPRSAVRSEEHTSELQSPLNL